MSEIPKETNDEAQITKDDNQKSENKTPEHTTQKKSTNYFFPIIVISILLFLYYIIFMRRTFIRSDERFPFFWDETLNKTLKKYVTIFPSRYILFLNGPYKSGKSRTLYQFSKDLNRKGRLVINFNFDSYTSTLSILQQMKIDIQNALISVRPFLSSYSMKQAQLFNVESIHQMPIGLDQNLYGVYNNLITPLDSIIESLEKHENISTSNVWEFVEILNEYHESLKPVIFVHNIDNLISDSKSPLFDIFRSCLIRKNLYEDFVPIVIEIHDSPLLYLDDQPILNGFDCMNQYRLVTTKGLLNESAANVLIRSRLFTSTEIRKLQREFGHHGGVWSDVLEDLRYGIKLETAVSNQQKRIEGHVRELIQDSKNSQSKLLEQKISKLLSRLCRSRGNYFFPEKEVVNLLRNLYKYGYIYDDESMTTHLANKAVYRAICSSK